MTRPVFVAGVGMTPFGAHKELSVRQLAALALDEALADAGAAREDIQAAYFGNATQGALQGQHAIRGQVVLRSLGMQALPVVNVENACATGSTALHLAAQHIRSGAADIVLALGVEKMVIEDKARALALFDSGWDIEQPEANLRELSGGFFDTRELMEGGRKRSLFMDLYPICKVRRVDIFQRIDDDPKAFAADDIAEMMNGRPIEGANYETQSMAMPFELAQRGEIYLMSQGAGGGWGDVLERESAAVARDVRDGVISAEVARKVYAVVVDAQTNAIDEAATAAARDAVRQQRLARGRPFAAFAAEWTTPGPQGLPAPYFGCWNDPSEIWVGNEEVPSPADALQPITMEDPRLVRIRELEAEVAALRGAQERA